MKTYAISHRFFTDLPDTVEAASPADALEIWAISQGYTDSTAMGDDFNRPFSANLELRYVKPWDRWVWTWGHYHITEIGDLRIAQIRRDQDHASRKTHH